MNTCKNCFVVCGLNFIELLREHKMIEESND